MHSGDLVGVLDLEHGGDGALVNASVLDDGDVVGATEIGFVCVIEVGVEDTVNDGDGLRVDFEGLEEGDGVGNSEAEHVGANDLRVKHAVDDGDGVQTGADGLAESETEDLHSEGPGIGGEAEGRLLED